MSLQDLSNQNNLETLGWQKPQQQATKQKKKITIRSERLQDSSEKNSGPRPSVTFRSEAHTQQDGCAQRHYCEPHRLTGKYSQHRSVFLKAIAGWQALPVKQQSHPRPGRQSLNGEPTAHLLISTQGAFQEALSAWNQSRPQR